jgi:protein TonB
MDQDEPPASGDDHKSPPALTAPKTVGLRHLIGAAIVTPMVLAAGVLWLHHVPAGLMSRTSDAVVEVRLVTQDPVDQPKEPSPQVAFHAPVVPPDTLVEDPVRAIPKAADPAPEQARTAPASAPPKKTDAGSPAAHAVLADKAASIFQQKLLSHIARYRLYPNEAKRDGIQGVVTVLFAMRRDGTVTDVWVRGTSGSRTLDVAAIDTIRRAVPLPSIPSEMPDSLNVLIPVAFNLP